MGNADLKSEVVVIGGGPGGYVAAIRLAQLGKKVILVDEDKLGGICLNYGCIPSKAMIYAADLFHKIKNTQKIGIFADKVSIDFKKMQEWKKGVVTKLNKGVEFLCKKNNVAIIIGTAFFEGPNRLKITNNKDVSFIDFENAVIATGSKPIELPNFKFDGKTAVNSREALYFEDIPKKLVVIGGGYIGMELGTVYAKLGSKVSIVEMTGQILPGFEESVVNIVQKNLEKLNVDIYLNTKADKIENNKIAIESKDKGKILLDADKVLVAVGRYPNTKNLGLENTKIGLDRKGFIQVDKYLKTGEENIHAIGDVSIGPMLAHKASSQGKLVAEIITGSKNAYENIVVPAVIFTDPEIAVVGMNEQEAKDKQIETKIGKFPFSALGRAIAKDETQGFVKIIAEKKNNKILGVQIVGGDASDLISEASLAIRMNSNLEDLALTIHPHPTLSESLMEAAEATMGKAIHILNIK